MLYNLLNKTIKYKYKLNKVNKINKYKKSAYHNSSYIRK